MLDTEPSAAPSRSAILLDSQRGQISRILMAVSDYGADTFGPAVARVLAGLPSTARLDILVSPGSVQKVSRWIAEAGPGALACIIEAPEELTFSLWTQDTFLARDDKTLLIPPHLERYQDLDAAIALAEGGDLSAQQTRFYFEGGNLIAAGDWLLIGEDTLSQNGGDLDGLSAQLDSTREPVLIGADLDGAHELTRKAARPAPGWTETINWRVSENSRQPLFHIDLFIAPAGIGPSGLQRFVVGCPRRGAQVLNHPIWPHALAGAFDKIAADLEDQGAEVIRNPMPLIWKDNEAEQHRTWYHLPVNNVLVEDREGFGKTVWLPCFSGDSWPELAEIDDTNAAIWAMMGYSVIRIPGLRSLAENLGALHCMAKVIERT